jgi:putative endonuclease
MGNGKDTWYVYMVRCSDGTFYTGITTDLEKRIAAHNSGRDGAKYTRSRRPVQLVYAEKTDSRSAAARLEHRIKRLDRAGKMTLAGDQCIMPPT